MFRRCLSALVILGFATGQLAAVPHAHGTGSGEDHGAMPHLHLTWFGHDDAHSHHADHSHGHHGHSHADHRQSTAKSSSASAEVSDNPSEVGQAELNSRGGSHDDDAIYLPGTSCVPATANQTELGASPWQILLVVWVSGDAWGLCKSIAQPPPRPIPDIVLDDSKTYLTLRNLRI